MSTFDLNLLRILDTLERTRHVGRAAEALDLSQSGFSTALGRLRRHFGDELFVRSAGRMQPTPCALALVATARSVLQQIRQDILGTKTFDPSLTDLAFRIAMSDVAEAVFMPGLIRHLARHAPKASVHVSAPGISPIYEGLAQGDIDFAVGYYPALKRDACFRQPVMRHTYACVVRRGHPVLSGGMSTTAYQAMGHAVVANAARSNALLNDTLARHGLRRRVVLSSPNHLSLGATIAATDLVATIPLGTAVDFSRSIDLQVVALPFRPPTFTIYQYWHQRTHREAGYQWLRKQFALLFNAGTDPYAAHRVALYGKRRAAP
jgi:DNA-binding transcriptional LysR family regulator